jgi:hypothetical protein
LTEKMDNFCSESWLIALDIDGTLVHDDGYLSPEVVKQVQRVKNLGQEHETFRVDYRHFDHGHTRRCTK